MFKSSRRTKLKLSKDVQWDKTKLVLLLC